MEVPKQLLEDQRKLETWLKTQGVVFCTDPVETVGAEEMFVSIARTFPAYIPECCQHFFCYKCSEQPEHLRDDDGIAWRYCTDDDTIFAIGVSVEALEQGMSYATMVTLHELAHVLCDIAEIGGNDDHDERFHSILDGLIKRYNHRNGTTVENDYFGLESCSDDRKSY